MKKVMTLLATTVLLIALLAGTAMAQSSASASASASAAAAASATASASAPATAQYDQYATATPTAGVTELPATGGAEALALLAGVLLVGGGLVVARKL
jgi:LPXTG-motif cell wall-anchored protein